MRIAQMATEEPGLETGWTDEPLEILDQESIAPAPARRGRWGMGLSLLVLSLLGTAAILPFSISLMRQVKGNGITPSMVPAIAVISLVIEGAISAVAIAIGFGLGRRTGLGPFMLDGMDGNPGSVHTGEPTDLPRFRAWKSIGLASALGLLLGVGIIGCNYAFQSGMPELATKIEHPPFLESLLGSVGAGIREEVWLRLGLMTLLAWLGTVITRRAPGNSAVIWTANVLSALAFGAIHLPQAAMLIGLNAAVVGFVLIGNGIPGIAFGWLFWRKGLIAAMVSHFMLDVVLKVILPAVTA
jgi:hypothetical protein